MPSTQGETDLVANIIFRKEVQTIERISTETKSARTTGINVANAVKLGAKAAASVASGGISDAFVDAGGPDHGGELDALNAGLFRRAIETTLESKETTETVVLEFLQESK